MDPTNRERVRSWLTFLRLGLSDENWDETVEVMKKDYFALVSDVKLQKWHEIYVPKQDKLNLIGYEHLNEKHIMLIHADMIRTGRKIFFLTPLQEPQGAKADDALSAFNEHVRRVERMLYCFAVINITVSYMQGFNELIMPLYYVITTGLDADLDTCEAICFFAFQRLIIATGVHELYSVNDQAIVVFQKLEEFDALLARHRPALARDLKMNNVNSMQYCYRWFTLLFGQEYDLPILLQIWDRLFTHKSEIMDYAYYVGIAQLMEIENSLLEAPNMTVKLELLQRLNIDAITRMLHNADVMWDKDHKDHKSWWAKKKAKKQEKKQKEEQEKMKGKEAKKARKEHK